MVCNLFRKKKTAPTSKSFITRNGSKLYMDSHEYRFSSFCAPELLDCDTTGTYEIKDTMSSLGMPGAFYFPVTRTYTLRIRSKNIGNGHINGWNGQDWDWSEGQLQEMDQVLDEAAKNNVRVIIPIINEDTGPDSNWAGTYTDLIAMKHGISYDEARQSNIDWWTDDDMWQSFQLILSKLLDRQNTKNGRKYSEDPTILCWETGNEMNCKGNQPAPADWTIKVAKFIKGKAPNTLVMDGSFARNDSVEHCYREEVLKCPEVDIFSYHYYGSGDIHRVTKDCKYVHSFNKVFIAGEYGFFENTSDYKQFLSLLYSSHGTGGLVWSLRPHSSKGGFKTHSEGNEIYSYHLPGFKSDDPRFDSQEYEVVKTVRDYSFKMGKAKTPDTPVPPAPTKIWVENGVLRWTGAPWAKEYEMTLTGPDGQSHTCKVTDCFHDGNNKSCISNKAHSFLENGNGQVAVHLTAISGDGKKGPASETVRI